VRKTAIREIRILK
jgi:cyclin-dependent kinase-like